MIRSHLDWVWLMYFMFLTICHGDKGRRTICTIACINVKLGDYLYTDSSDSSCLIGLEAKHNHYNRLTRWYMRLCRMGFFCCSNTIHNSYFPFSSILLYTIPVTWRQSSFNNDNVFQNHLTKTRLCYNYNYDWNTR